MPSALPHGESAGPAFAQTSLGDVARERKHLRLAQRREQRQRIQHYKAVMQVMKQRGVKGLAAAPRGPEAERGRVEIRASAAGPLRVLAEGDSWFDYPVPFFGGGIVERLKSSWGCPF